MDNIEKLTKMKELCELKAELHKMTILERLPWNQQSFDDSSFSKVMRYGQLGYSIFQLFSDSSNGQANSE